MPSEASYKSEFCKSFRSYIFSCCVSLLLIISLFPSAVFAETTVLTLGDSLTAGYGLEKDQAFPYLLEKKLHDAGFNDVKVVNGGFSGSTSASAFKRLKWYLRIKPEILVLELGANDGLRGLSIDSIRNNLEQTIRFALEQNMKVVLAGMKMPLNYGREYTSQYEAVFTSLAKQYRITLIPFLLEGVAGDKSLNLADGIHPNEQGHKIVAETVFKYIQPLLQNTGTSPSGK